MEQKQKPERFEWEYYRDWNSGDIVQALTQAAETISAQLDWIIEQGKEQDVYNRMIVHELTKIKEPDHEKL